MTVDALVAALGAGLLSGWRARTWLLLGFIALGLMGNHVWVKQGPPAA